MKNKYDKKEDSEGRKIRELRMLLKDNNISPSTKKIAELKLQDILTKL